MKDRLADLVRRAKLHMWGKTIHSKQEENQFIADYLIAHGAILPPCKVGDTVYYHAGRFEKQGRKKVYIEFVESGIVDRIIIGEKGTPQIDVCNDENVWTTFDAEDDFGIIAFTDKNLAEKALNENRGTP